MRQLMPGENISVNSVDNSLVLSGDVSSAGRAEKARALAASVASATDVKNAVVVNQLAVNTPNQVNLRVKIAEVNRTALKALGFNWAKSPANCSVAGSALGGIACGTTSNLLASVANPLTNQAIGTENAIAYGIPIPGSSSRLEAIIDALSQENLITTLAEPNLTATSGQTASFLAGGEFPVPVAAATGTSGTPTITIDFKTFGVELDFTPTIIDAIYASGFKVRSKVSHSWTSTGAVSVPINASATVTILRADGAPCRNHRRPRKRRKLRSCRAAAEHQRTGRLEDSLARRHPGHRTIVPLQPFPAQRNRACHHRDAVSGQAERNRARHAG